MTAQDRARHEQRESNEATEQGRIRLLSDALIDQIAAGEVVERPASVVKELVENSLDAGARRVAVEVRDGGAALIAVTDDGEGMTPAELPLALQRHATSKLASADDLMRIRSFGFRGEALPAIASVSRFRILSRARGAEHGYEILCEAGSVRAEREAAGPEGTRIEVADLFESVPARRKFLKRPGTEWGHIADWLARLALARPDIHLEMRRDDRRATIWPACRDFRDRIAMVLSDDDAAALVEVDHETPDATIRAFVSTPERTRPNGQGLYLFVNGRPVRDRLLRHAVLEAYRDLLPRGRFPVGVVFVEVPPEAVDVNVHPAKWEVRFGDSQAVHRAIRHAIRDAMSSRSWLAGGGRGAATTGPRFAPRHGSAQPTSPEPGTDDWIFAGAGEGAAVGADRSDRVAEATDHADPASAAVPDDVLATATRGAEPMAGPGQAGSPVGQVGAGAAPVASFAALRLLGQLRASYLLAESEHGLMVVDQHAAHERILYERLRRDWLERGVPSQGLLAPVTVPLAPRSVAALEAATGTTARLGFEIEAFGDDAVLVRAIPAELSGQDVAALVTELASALAEIEREGDTEEETEASAVRWLPTLDRLFATMACHAARRFGDRLPVEEQRAILEGLDTIPWAPTCPHGRPVAILLSHDDLELRFRRR